MDQFGIPTLEELTQFNVNRAGQIEGIRSSLYDFQAYATAGQTSLTFFQVPQGQSSKTLADTNMEAAGSLPSPKRFLIESIEVFFFSGVVPSVIGANTANDQINDLYNVGKSGWLNLFIGSKSYLTEAPLLRFPPKNAIHAVAARADTSTAGAAQNSHVGYASWGGQPYKLQPPILLVPTQNFNITLNWPTAVATPSGVDGRIGVVLNGILYRNSQ